MSLAETVRALVAKHQRLTIVEIREGDRESWMTSARPEDRFAAHLGSSYLSYGRTIQEALEAADRAESAKP